MLKENLIGTAITIVNNNNTAAFMKSGSLAVFATPSMCALMEEASCNAINQYLEKDTSTVGISLNINHSRATALNDTVKATATLTKIDGRMLIFNVKAEDSKGVIGEGEHKRFIINTEKFMSKVNS